MNDTTGFIGQNTGDCASDGWGCGTAVGEGITREVIDGLVSNGFGEG